MSNLLTETRNYQNMLEKRRKINEIKENELNKECSIVVHVIQNIFQ